MAALNINMLSLIYNDSKLKTAKSNLKIFLRIDCRFQHISSKQLPFRGITISEGYGKNAGF